MKRLTTALCASVLVMGTAGACDDHHGECTIEDWRWNSVPGTDFVMLDGVATCDKGKAALRLYEGEGGKFLGSDTAYIEQHIFQAMVQGIQTSRVRQLLPSSTASTRGRS